jgi:hypothetical protein
MKPDLAEQVFRQLDGRSFLSSGHLIAAVVEACKRVPGRNAVPVSAYTRVIRIAEKRGWIIEDAQGARVAMPDRSH